MSRSNNSEQRKGNELEYPFHVHYLSYRRRVHFALCDVNKNARKMHDRRGDARKKKAAEKNESRIRFVRDSLRQNNKKATTQ